MTSIRDGRGCAAEYFAKLASAEQKTLVTAEKDAQKLNIYQNLTNLFSKEKALAENMWSLFDTCDETPRHEKLAEKAVREKACKYILQIEALEKQSLAALQELVCL